MRMKIYLNEKFVSSASAKLEHNDRGLLLGDGIFETVRVHSGTLFYFDAHYDRLKKSANLLSLPFTIPIKKLQQIINNLLKINELNKENASIRITLTRGCGPRGLIPPKNIKPTLMITTFPFTPVAAKPYKVFTSQIRRNEPSPLSNIKSLCYLDNVLAKMDAVKSGADECLLLNTKDNVACTSVANIFIVIKKGIVTPKIQDGILPGITRKVIIEICINNKIPIFEETISTSDLRQATEIFCTNTLIGVQTIGEINSQLINNGKVGEIVLLLQKLYANKINA